MLEHSQSCDSQSHQIPEVQSVLLAKKPFQSVNRSGCNKDGKEGMGIHACNLHAGDVVGSNFSLERVRNRREHQEVCVETELEDGEGAAQCGTFLTL